MLTGEGADEIFAGYEYLRDFRTEEELHAELVRIIEGSHDLILSFPRKRGAGIHCGSRSGHATRGHLQDHSWPIREVP